MATDTLVFGSDGVGYTLKMSIVEMVQEMGFEVLDAGCHGTETVHYCVYARDLAMAIKEGKAERGFLFCGSGVGVCMMANRFPWIRAAQVYDPTVAFYTRDHNNANVACFGEKFNGLWNVQKCVEVFLETPFCNEGRHVPRQRMLSEPFGDFF